MVGVKGKSGVYVHRSGNHLSPETISKIKQSKVIKPNTFLFQKGNQYGFKKGQVAWNKGLTKETDLRVMKYATSLTGKKLSEEHIRKSRLNHHYLFGENHPMFGKHHSEKTKKLRSIQEKNNWMDNNYRDKRIKAILNGLIQRPTSYEQKISNLCIQNNLPFIYSGNGTFLIGHKNPDFINKEKKVAIEVYHTYFKERDFGSCEEYERQRAEYFLKYGYKTIFIRTKEIESKDWKEICLSKLKEGLKN